MPLNDFQRERCLKIIEKLMGLDICKPFIQMVDPEKDGASDYYDVISEGMALCEVKRRLESGEYEDLEGFKRDVNLIWQNAVEYNGIESYYAALAKEASLVFSKKMEDFPTSHKGEWLTKVQRAAKDFYETLCHPPSELDPNQKIASQKDVEDN